MLFGRKSRPSPSPQASRRLEENPQVLLCSAQQQQTANHRSRKARQASAYPDPTHNPLSYLSSLPRDGQPILSSQDTPPALCPRPVHPPIKPSYPSCTVAASPDLLPFLACPLVPINLNSASNSRLSCYLGSGTGQGSTRGSHIWCRNPGARVASPPSYPLPSATSPALLQFGLSTPDQVSPVSYLLLPWCMWQRPFLSVPNHGSLAKRRPARAGSPNQAPGALGRQTRDAFSDPPNPKPLNRNDQTGDAFSGLSYPPSSGEAGGLEGCLPPHYPSPLGYCSETALGWQEPFAAHTMGNVESKIPTNTPLGCLLLNFTCLGYSQTLRRKKLIFLSQVAWPQYQLDNRSHWPPPGTFDFNVLHDLDNFCRQASKDKEVPYVQAFWDLHSHPDLCSSCSTHQVLLARTPPPQTPTSPTKPPPYTLQEEMPDHLSSPFVPTPEVPDPPNPPPSVSPPAVPPSSSPPTPSATPPDHSSSHLPSLLLPRGGPYPYQDFSASLCHSTPTGSSWGRGPCPSPCPFFSPRPSPN
uniref:Uncharacterized protein n=1 Tax=Callithrix jacchus TaxID=9483 RepID=A0A8I3WRH0_CALJA